MKLILTTDDGEVLDGIDVSRSELADAQRRGDAALELVNSLEPGADAQ
jgi:hypothetical protein